MGAAHCTQTGLGTRWIPHLRHQQQRVRRPGPVCLAQQTSMWLLLKDVQQ